VKTIRHQLLLGLLAGGLLCTALAGVALYRKVLEEANEMCDYQLRQLALTLPFPGAQPPPREAGDPEEEMLVQVWDRAGLPVYTSAPRPLLPRAARLGFTNAPTASENWRVYAVRREGGQVQVAQQVSDREALAAKMALRSLLPFLLMFPMLGILIYVVVGRSVRPLENLARSLGQRSPLTLHPLSPVGLSPELAPVVTALNDLLAQLQGALASQRAFIADAAHELRSPLAALKLQAQLAERAGDLAQRSVAFVKLHERLDRTTHLVAQLLLAAREEDTHRMASATPLDLLELARQCVGDRYLLADSRAIDLGVVCPDAIDEGGATTVLGDPDSLQVLLGNLVDNALRYAPGGSRVDVIVSGMLGQVVLQVVDAGPGIPEHERARVFDRFYRGELHHGAGSGMGLAIVKSIAAVHGAAVTLGAGADGAGLTVAVRFSAAPLSSGAPANGRTVRQAAARQV
jgi:two-component system OmpR family sensor kinase